MNRIPYYLHLIPSLLLQLLVFKTKTHYEDESRRNRRIKGAAIIISNHRTFWDGLVIALRFFFKRLHFLATDFYRGGFKIIKLIMYISGGIFVGSEEHRVDFIEKSKKVISKGRPIMVFPEGGHQKGYEPQKFSTGYIMLAVKTGVKIVPVVNDFNYGLFKRVNLMIGNSIDLSCYSNTELTKEKLKEINKEIYTKFLLLFYELKRRKAQKFSFKYEFTSVKPADVIRINAGSYYHYGIYLSADEVIQFGNAVNRTGENVIVNSVSMKEFCGDKIPEVRIINKKYLRKADDIKNYAKSCLGQSMYNFATNNCLDFANRVTLKI